MSQFDPSAFLGQAGAAPAQPPQAPAPAAPPPPPAPVPAPQPQAAPQGAPRPHYYGPNQGQQGQQQSKNPPHGKLYNTFNNQTRRWGKTITATDEGKDYLLANIGSLQNPQYKLKIKVFEFSEEVQAKVKAQGGYTTGHVYFKLDDGQQKYGGQ